MIVLFTIAAGLLLAYANGANDNFKGVATLVGSRTTAYRGALAYATVTTFLGSLTALVVAKGLLAAFSGKGLVPQGLVADPAFVMPVAFAAGVTVLLATRWGWPISTTHALVGGLIGSGLVVSSTGIDVSKLGNGFLLPLLISPVLALVATMVIYPALSSTRRRLGIKQETCVCIDNKVPYATPQPATHSLTIQSSLVTGAIRPGIIVADDAVCRVRYRGRALGIRARPTLDGAHYLSAGMVCFARGLNDTPKLAALVLVGDVVSPGSSLVGVAIAIAIGGVLTAKRVASTMSEKITSMNPGQGLTANLITGLLVIGASRWGLPVSTTHVSCGSLFGIGLATGQGRGGAIRNILLAWVITLPVAAALSAGAAAILG